MPLEAQVTKIINKRRKGAIWGAAIIFAVLAYEVYKKTLAPTDIVFAIFAAIAALLLILSFVNHLNYPAPKPWYRKVNKIVYLYMSRVIVVTALMQMFGNIRKARYSSSQEPLVEAAADGLIAKQQYDESKRAEIIEAYFKQNANNLASDPGTIPPNLSSPYK